MDTLEGERLWQRAAELGAGLASALGEELAATDGVVEIRGRGLMLGIELDRPCGELVGRALEEGC